MSTVQRYNTKKTQEGGALADSHRYIPTSKTILDDINGRVEKYSTPLGLSTDDSKLPTSKAVRAYIDKRIQEVMNAIPAPGGTGS